jgi:luciferase family oxidoreductase group 1
LQFLRRDPSAAERFPRDVQELQLFLGPVEIDQGIQAVPGANTRVPIWILGSSTYGAQVAAILGLPYAFASHFAPDALTDALAIYRERFKPSEQLDRPYAMVGIQLVAAETDAEARRLFTTVQQGFTLLRRGRPGPQQPPIDDIEAFWSEHEKAQASHMLRYAIVGSPETVRRGLERLLAETQADEVMVVSNIFDHAARVRSYEILAEVAGSMGATEMGAPEPADATVPADAVRA